jgi:hypothetical protein
MALLDDPQCVKLLLQTGKKRRDIEATCRALDISRSTFRRLMAFIADLVVSGRDMQKQAAINRRTAAKAKLREQLLVLVDANPLLGCKQLAKALSRETPVSFPTVQKLLNEAGLGKKQQRILRLIDQVVANQTLNLSDTQIIAVAKAKPSAWRKID